MELIRAVVLKCVPHILACILLAGSIAHAAYAQNAVPSAENLLIKFSDALRTLNYQGVFTYEYSGKLETFGLLHLVEDGVERDLIYRTNGPEQSFSRVVDAGCHTIGGKFLYGRQLTSANGDLFGLQHFYRIAVAGNDRIAGRDVWVVQFVPKDEFRYGMSLAIDQENHLLMRYIVFDEQKKSALERMQFASIKVGANAEELLSSAGETHQDIPGSRCVGDTYSPSGHSPWKPTWLPPGFILTEYSYAEEEGHMETYTDGLHSFSLFVKRSELPVEYDQRVHQGSSSNGALTALLTMDPYQNRSLPVSDGGEVPPRHDPRAIH